MWATEVPPEAARRVGIVGAGVIGGGWALHFLRTGFDVDVYDPAPAARTDLLRTVEASWPLLARIGLRDGASPDRLTFHDSVAAAVAGADLVQENAPENGPVKQRVLAEADRVARPDYQVSPALAELFPQRRERLGEEPGPVRRHGQRRVHDEQRHHLPGTSARERERRVVAHPQVTGEQHDCGLHHSPPRSHAGGGAATV